MTELQAKNIKVLRNEVIRLNKRIILLNRRIRYYKKVKEKLRKIYLEVLKMDEVIENVEATPQVDEHVKVKGKPKSEEWKRGQSERMKLAHARRKALKEGISA